MSNIEKLTETFEKFPGIGPRQAKRFVYFLLTRNRGFLEDLSSNILSLKKNIKVCEFCRRFYQSENNSKLCRTCDDNSRESNVLMIVEKDADLEAIESAGVYNGRYFVLGGVVPILEENPESKIRSRELVALIEKESKENGLNEIIIATSANPEGDNTELFLLETLKPFGEKGLKVSVLGRGLSTGTELEYSDKDTIENALKNRH